VHFRSATEPFDTASPAGRLFLQMLGAFAEFEREVIIDRVITAWNAKPPTGNGPTAPARTATCSTPPLSGSPHTRTSNTWCGRSDHLNTEGKRTRAGRAGCTAPRIDADELDTAVTQALLALYTDTTVIADAIAEQQQCLAEHSQQHTTELAGIAAQIRTAEAAIDRLPCCVRERHSRRDRLRAPHPRPHHQTRPAHHPSH
jgi:Resolvase, N terminal domain